MATVSQLVFCAYNGHMGTPRNDKSDESMRNDCLIKTEREDDECLCAPRLDNDCYRKPKRWRTNRVMVDFCEKELDAS